MIDYIGRESFYKHKDEPRQKRLACTYVIRINAEVPMAL